MALLEGKSTNNYKSSLRMYFRNVLMFCHQDVFKRIIYNDNSIITTRSAWNRFWFRNSTIYHLGNSGNWHWKCRKLSIAKIKIILHYLLSTSFHKTESWNEWIEWVAITRMKKRRQYILVRENLNHWCQIGHYECGSVPENKTEDVFINHWQSNTIQIHLKLSNIL